MLVELFKRYWFEIVVIVIISGLLVYIKHLNNEISSIMKDNTILQSKLNESNAYINVQNAAILANEVEYNASITKLKTELSKINTKYITKTTEVVKWRDNNATQNDCNSSISYLNNYKF